VASGGILLLVIVWRVVVFCYGLLCGEWWYFVMGYCVASVGILLWVIVWRVVVFCYGLLCGQWWYFLTDVSGQTVGLSTKGMFSRNIHKKLYTTCKVFQYVSTSSFV